MRFLLALLLYVLSLGANAQPASCAAEAGLQGRTDILHCEPWTSSTWWQNGYRETGRKYVIEPAEGPDQTSVESSNCVGGGTCLKVRCRAWNDGGCTGALAHHWPIPGNQEEVFLRYYIRTSANWSPQNYAVSDGSAGDNGGKWPGLADVRAPGDPAWTGPNSGLHANGQCGNGGEYSDGINCWSARLKYRNCIGSGGANLCPEGNTRIGFYHYVPPDVTNNNQTFSAFDRESWGTDNAGTGTGCAAHRLNLGSTGSDATSCGQGAAGIANNVWYRVELHIRMNTPGVDNGIAEAIITREGSNYAYKYRKSNMRYREVGHDNLHVRTVWLDVHMGGESVGPLTESYIHLARMCVATHTWCGAYQSSGSYASSPFGVSVTSASTPFASLAAGNWQQLGTGTRISGVTPGGITGNPINITEAWNGATVDTTRNRLIVYGGGHNDYFGNEVYALDLAATPPVMLRIRNPAADVNSCNANGDPMADGSPASRHTYGGLTYAASVDRMIQVGGAKCNDGDMDLRVWSLQLPAPGTWTSNGHAWVQTGNFIAKWDSVTGLVYMTDRDNLFTINPSTLAVTQRGSITGNVSLFHTGALDTNRRRLVMCGAGACTYQNLDSPYAGGSLSMSSVPASLSDANPGLDYDPIGDQFCAWSGGSNVHCMPAAGGAWVQRALNAGPSFVQVEKGTFGRFAYVPAYRVFVLVNAISENAWVFKAP